ERGADVVQQGGGQDQVGAQPGVELAELAADRGYADRVLEQPARVDVVAVGRGRERTQPLPCLGVEDGGDGRLQPRVGELCGEEVEEPVQLVRVAAHRRCQRGGI